MIRNTDLKSNRYKLINCLLHSDIEEIDGEGLAETKVQPAELVEFVNPSSDPNELVERFQSLYREKVGNVCGKRRKNCSYTRQTFLA